MQSSCRDATAADHLPSSETHHFNRGKSPPSNQSHRVHEESGQEQQHPNQKLATANFYAEPQQYHHSHHSNLPFANTPYSGTHFNSSVPSPPYYEPPSAAGRHATSGWTNNRSNNNSCVASPQLSSSAYFFNVDDMPYCKAIPMRVKQMDNREQVVPLTVKISNSSKSDRLPSLKLHIELTNEANPYFFYYLDLDDTEFYRVKAEQRLLVDFHSFPLKFIELLEQCLNAAHGSTSNSGTRLTAVFAEEASSNMQHPNYTQTHQPVSPRANSRQRRPMTAMSTPAGARLNLIEANQFKEITHLYLTLQRGDDTCIKQHLAKKLEETKNNFEESAAQVRLLESKTRELETQHASRAAELQRLLAEHQRTLTRTKQDLEAEKQSLELALLDKEQMLKSKLQSSDETVRQLNDTIAQLTSTTEDLQRSLRATKDNLSTTQHTLTLQEIRLQELEPLKIENEKLIAQLRNKLETAQKNEADVKQLLDTQKDALDEANAEKKIAVKHAKDLEQKLSSCAKEINRGNEIIAKQQTQIQALKSKIKGKIVDNQMQEKGLSEKETTIQSLKKELQGHKEQSTNVKVLQEEISEAKKTIEAKQAVIENLNNQLTHRELQTILQKYPPMLQQGPAEHRASLDAHQFLKPLDKTLAANYSSVQTPYGMTIGSTPSLTAHLDDPPSILTRSSPLPKFPALCDEEVAQHDTRRPLTAAVASSCLPHSTRAWWMTNTPILSQHSPHTQPRATADGVPVSALDDRDELFAAQTLTVPPVNALSNEDPWMQSSADNGNEYQPHPVPTQHL